VKEEKGGEYLESANERKNERFEGETKLGLHHLSRDKKKQREEGKKAENLGERKAGTAGDSLHGPVSIYRRGRIYRDYSQREY